MREGRRFIARLRYDVWVTLEMSRSLSSLLFVGLYGKRSDESCFAWGTDAWGSYDNPNVI